MKLMNIEFAPLNVPLERRLQTLSAALWFLVLGLGIAVSVCFIIGVFLYGYQWIKLLMIAYFSFCYYNRDECRRGGRNFGRRWMRNLIWWRYLVNYFPIKLVKTAEVSSSKNTIFCAFPHGLLSVGVSASFSTNALDCHKLYPGIDFRMVTLEQNFWCPLIREFIYTMGGVSCDSKSLEYLLSTKPNECDGPTENPVFSRGLVLVVGGAAEAFNSRPGNYTILLKRRKGFIRLALKYGAALVPVYSFGENDLYDQVSNPEGSWIRKCQEFLKKYLAVALVIPVGRGFFQYSFGLIPRRKPVNVVVGAAIDLPKIENPTQTDIEKYHAKFTNKLVELFETHKSKYVKDHENISLVLE